VSNSFKNLEPRLSLVERHIHNDHVELAAGRWLRSARVVRYVLRPAQQVKCLNPAGESHHLVAQAAQHSLGYSELNRVIINGQDARTTVMHQYGLWTNPYRGVDQRKVEGEPRAVTPRVPSRHCVQSQGLSRFR